MDANALSLLQRPESRWQPETLAGLARELTVLRDVMLAEEATRREQLAALPEDARSSARNLLHYVALRQHDLRPLQEALALLGLSSLGRAESHTLAAVDSVTRMLTLASRQEWAAAGDASAAPDLAASARVLSQRATAAFGAPERRRVRIMVTASDEAADPLLLGDLMAHGMDCLRINAAHGDAAAWTAIAEGRRAAESRTGRTCRLEVDLAGPKARIGPLTPGPAVVRLRPRRDVVGRVLEPALAQLVPAGSALAVAPDRATLPVDAAWLRALRTGDTIKVVDARGSSRVLKVVGAEPSRALVAARKTTYFVPGTHLRHCPEGQESSRPSSRTAVGALPPLPAPIVLHVGDQLWLTAPGMEGRPALLGPDGTTRQPARVSMSRPEILGRVAPGERVAIDDGKVWGTVEESGADGLLVRVTHARVAGARLLPGKSVAFPDSDLGLPAIGESDLPALAFAAAHADLLGLSFAERPEDVHALRERLAALSTRAVGIVLKIETRRGFERLPELLLAGLCHPVSAVMIARGDLAVDCGYERLAEVQEEILWMAEAAHVPVIWATQVLEDLTKTGQPTRAEITDAAMGERAECVMLNKGAHIVAAVKMLSGVLERMEEHQAKKTARLRPLAMARRFQDPGAPAS